MNNWIEKELDLIDLGDKRLNSRSKNILSKFSDKPSNSINCSFNGWHEGKASYRFLANSSVTAAKILLPHKNMTEERIKDSEIILCVQDTYYIGL